LSARLDSTQLRPQIALTSLASAAT
jgi:hypothetical protein